jgi:hypothetical protein
MTTQMFWIILAVFVLGLFIGSNLGIMILCVLQMAKQDHPVRDTVVSVSAQG